MKFSPFPFTLTFIAAAAPSAFASSLRGSENGNHDSAQSLSLFGSSGSGTPHHHRLFSQASMPVLPSEAHAHANANGKEHGLPFHTPGTTTTTTNTPGTTTTTTGATTTATGTTITTTTTTTSTTTTAGCEGGWKLKKKYCLVDSNSCIKFTTCPTSTAVGTTIGEYDAGSIGGPVNLDSIISSDNKEIVISIQGGLQEIPITVSDDGNSFDLYGNIFAIKA